MEYSWNEDEGYEIFYGRIVERYGKDIRPDPSAIRSELDRLERERLYLAEKANEDQRKLPWMIDNLKERRADFEKLRQDLEVQERHFEIGGEAPYAEKIKNLKQAIEQAESSIASKAAELERLKVEAAQGFDKEADFERLVKLGGYLISDAGESIHEPFIKPRNQPEPFDLSVDAYHSMMDRFVSASIDRVWYRPRDLAYSEADGAGPRVPWNALALQAVEILQKLRKAGRKVHVMNGRHFLEWGDDFHCLVGTSRIPGVKDSGEYRLGFTGAPVDALHPVLSGIKIQIPRPFIVFNDAVCVRHDFMPATFGSEAWWARKQPDDDDD